MVCLSYYLNRNLNLDLILHTKKTKVELLCHQSVVFFIHSCVLHSYVLTDEMVKPSNRCLLAAAVRIETEMIRQRPPVFGSKTVANRVSLTEDQKWLKCTDAWSREWSYWLSSAVCRWASVRGKSEPISSAPCATRAPSLKQKDPSGPGAGAAWPSQQWCMVWSRQGTKRSWEKPMVALVWLHVPFSAEGFQGCETIFTVPADLHLFIETLP